MKIFANIFGKIRDAVSGRRRGRSAAARNARANVIAAALVVFALVAAIVYAVALSGGEARRAALFPDSHPSLPSQPSQPSNPDSQPGSQSGSHSSNPDSETRPRWWSAEQLALGEKLYAEHCAECHGALAQGAPGNWREKNDDGTFPAPPLDGTAHAWHHDLGTLRRVVRFGGKPLGGTMPAFGEKLNRDEVDAVVARFQSLWPDEIYHRWNLREQRRKR